MKTTSLSNVHETFMIEAMRMVKFFHKVFRVSLMNMNSKTESNDWVCSFPVVAKAMDKMTVL